MLRRRTVFILFIMLLFGMLASEAQNITANSTVAPRITRTVDNRARVTLRGSVPGIPSSATDLGPAAGSVTLSHINLLLRRSEAQEAALQKYLIEVQQESSPNYHRWLTPEQFGQLYGPADSDIAAITAWLESQGFAVKAVSRGRTRIEFSGTGAQISQAFRTAIHSFSHNGEQFYSTTAEATIPAALAPVVSGIAHLDTRKPKAQISPGQSGRFDHKAERFVTTPAAASSGSDEYTHTTSTGAHVLMLTPADAATIYNTPVENLNANYASTTPYTGDGASIGLVGVSAIDMTPVVNYRHLYLKEDPGTAPTVYNVDGVTETDSATEAYLDLEIAGGMAPGADLYFYTATDLGTAAAQAVEDNIVDFLSMSFGSCEEELGASADAFWNSLWQQASIQGIAVTISSGDEGSANCNHHHTETIATHGLAVNGFASTPYNIAVGGTDYYGLLNNFDGYVSGTNSSTTYYRTALGYIPESTWNSSTATNTSLSQDAPGSRATIDAGSGGRSSCSSAASGGNCVGYPKPYWQRGPGIPKDGVRDLPDVSLMASNGVDGGEWLICTNTTADVEGVTITRDCSTQSDGDYYFQGTGGTSASTPAFAGILALVMESQGGVRLGQAAVNLYNLSNGPHAGAIFHDVSVGNIAVPCVAGTPDCVLNSAGHYYESGYDAAAGYDLATGLGSVDATNLVTYWTTSEGTGTVTVTVSPANAFAYVSAPISVTVSVAAPQPSLPGPCRFRQAPILLRPLISITDRPPLPFPQTPSPPEW